MFFTLSFDPKLLGTARLLTFITTNLKVICKLIYNQLTNCKNIPTNYKKIKKIKNSSKGPFGTAYLQFI